MKLQTFFFSVLLIILATLVLAGVLPEHHARTAKVIFFFEMLCAFCFVLLIHYSQQWQAQKKSLAEAEALQAQGPQPSPAPVPPPGDTPPEKFGIGNGSECDTVVRITPDGAQSVIRPTAKPEADLELEICEE